MANYNNRGGYRGNSNGYNSQRREKKKRSGARFHNGKDGKPFITGWKYDRNQGGIVSFIASPFKSKNGETKRTKSASGREWENWVIKIQKPMSKEEWVYGLFDVQKRRVLIPELNLMLSPNGGKGGYTGKYMGS